MISKLGLSILCIQATRSFRLQSRRAKCFQTLSVAMSQAKRVSEIDTPSLLLDLDAFHVNCKRMDEMTANLGLKLRPHAKSHKSAEIGRMQTALPNCRGLCVSKVDEAEAIVKGGVKDVLLTNEIVALPKIEKVVQLLKICDSLSVCCDNKKNAAQLNMANQNSGKKLGVYIEVDVGQGRCGVAPGEACADLIEYIQKECNSLDLRGLQCYSGWNQHVKDVPARIIRTQEVVDKVEKSLLSILHRGLLTVEGISRLEITGAGTGTWNLESKIPFSSPELAPIQEKRRSVFTELQPGSYAFMDNEYGQTEPCEATQGHFKQSLFVLTTIMSDASAHPKWLVVDAGDKAIHPGNAVVKVDGYPELSYRRGGDEHGIIEGPEETLAQACLEIGRTLKLVPGHCDPTINFFEEFYGFHGDVVDRIISIDARGPGR